MKTQYTYPNTFLVWSKDNETLEMAQKAAKELKIDLFFAKQEEDIYAVPFFFALIDEQFLTKEIFQNLVELFEDLDKKYFAIMVYPQTKFKIPVKIKKYFLASPLILDYKTLKLAVLCKKHLLDRQKNTNRVYLSRMERCFYIMRKLLEPNGRVKMDDLCAEFRVDPKTIKRDLDLFKLTGEYIAYNKVGKFYYLNHSYND